MKNNTIISLFLINLNNLFHCISIVKKFGTNLIYILENLI